MRKEILFITLLAITINLSASGKVESKDVEMYLENIEGLTIIDKSQDYSLGDIDCFNYTYVFNGNDGNPLYDELLKNPKILRIIAPIEKDIMRMIKKNEVLYVFLPCDGNEKSLDCHTITLYDIDTGQVIQKTKMNESSRPFFWEEANLFVYVADYYTTLNLYNANTLELVKTVPLSEDEKINIQFGLYDVIGFTEEKIIAINKKSKDRSIILYDIFTQTSNKLIDLAPISKSHFSVSCLKKISDYVIQFTFLTEDTMFTCEYDLTKMVVKDVIQ